MESAELKQILLSAVNASISAGVEILKIYKSDFEVELKDDNSPLTIADKKSNDIIYDALASFEIPFLSEEGKEIPYNERKEWDYLFIIDPLDGTKEFVKKNGEFTVNIALVNKDKPILGVIYSPVSGELFFSLADFGVYKKTTFKSFSDIKLLINDAIELPKNNERTKYVIVGSRSHMSKETQVFFEKKKNEYNEVEIFAIGSSLKICMVAEGKADVYPRYAPTMEWDTAAGHAIANMAGFKVLKYQSNEEIKYNKKSLLNPWFLVTKN